MIKAVIFDWGGVLIEDPSMALRQHCAEKLGVPVGKFCEVFEPYQDAFHRGQISEAELWREVCGKLGVDAPTGGFLWKEAFREAYAPSEEVFGLAESLRKRGYKTGFLSNTEKPSVEFFRQQGHDMFDVEVFSCEEGMAKPDEEIYLRMVERLGTRPEECVFIDDKEEYIKGAGRAGLMGIVFSSFRKTIKELEKLGVRP